MPLLTPVIPLPTAEFRPFWATEELAVAQGREARQVRDEIENVSRHWRQQSLAVIADPEADPLDELNDYRHVPFERAGTRRVRYARIRELQPRKIDFDEFDEEE